MKWQFQFVDAKSKHGPLFAGARTRVRGEFKAAKDLPAYVREYLRLERSGGRWYYGGGGSSTAEMKKQIDDAKSGVVWNPKIGPGLTGTVDIPEPKIAAAKREISKRVPAIRNLRQLCDHFSADEPAELNKRVYEGASCGASISVRTKDGKWHHSGEDWKKIREIDAFTIQSIVKVEEFILPVTVKEVDDWMAEMERQCQFYWERDNSTLGNKQSGDKQS